MWRQPARRATKGGGGERAGALAAAARPSAAVARATGKDGGEGECGGGQGEGGGGEGEGGDVEGEVYPPSIRFDLLARSEAPDMHIVRKQRLAYALGLGLRVSAASTAASPTTIHTLSPWAQRSTVR